MQAELGSSVPMLSPSKMAVSIASPNAADSPSEAMIKANWHPGQSRIPTPPKDYCLNTPAEKLLKTKGLFHSPLPTPSTVDRESTLREMEFKLEAKLSGERRAQSEVMKKLEAVETNQQPELAESLRDEASKRSARIFVLSQKLTRTRKTLAHLTTAKEDYHSSAKKVQEFEEKLQKPSKIPAARNSKRLSSAEASSLRQELDRATSMMNAACRRVEQIESITDALVKQLADAEAELAEVQQLREEENSVHADQVHRLTSERASLSLKLETAQKKIKDLEKQEEKLNAKLTVAMAENNKKLKKERNVLASTLKDLRAQQKELAADLKAKEEQLAEAMERVNTGTPVGQGAKTVLPMALRRIKETQEALKAEEQSKAEMEEELTRLSVESAAREAALKLKLEEVEGERLRQVAEKQASLESMTRAVAAATKEAAVKQEAVNKLMAEVAALDTAREELQVELQNASARSVELEAKLASMHMELTAVAQEKEDTCAMVAELSMQAELATAVRDDLSSALDYTKATADALEQSIAAMKNRMDANNAAHSEEIAQLERIANDAAVRAQGLEIKLSEAVAAQTVALDECSKLKEQLQQQDASIADLTAAVAVARADAAEANGRAVDAQETAAVQRNQLLTSLSTMENELTAAVARRDQLDKELNTAQRMCKDMEQSINNLQSQLRKAQESLVAQEERMKTMVEENTLRLEAAMSHAMHAAQAQESMEGSVAHLQKKVEQLTEENSQLQSSSSDVALQMQDMKENMEKHLTAAMHAQSNLIAERTQLEQSMEEQKNAINHVSHVLKERNERVAELETQLEDVKSSMNDKLAQAMQSQADLVNQRTQLEGRVVQQTESIMDMTEALRSKNIHINELTSNMNAAQEVMHAQLARAIQMQSCLMAKKDELERHIQEQNASIRHLTDAMATRSARIVELEAIMEDMRVHAADTAAALCSQLDAAVNQRDAINNKLSILSAGMTDIAHALDAATNATSSTIDTADYSNIVDAALAKIQKLHDALDGARRNAHSKATIIAERDATIAQLHEAGRQREELAAALQHRMEAAVDAAEAQSAALQKELNNERELVKELERVNGEIAPHLEKLTVELEHSMASHKESIAQSEQALHTVTAERDALAQSKAAVEAELTKLTLELDAARSDTQSREEGSKKVLQLSFQKIKALEAAVAEKSALICELESRLECVEDMASQLAADLTAKETALTAAENMFTEKVRGLEMDNAALERAMCRLRVDVEEEFEKRKNAEADVVAAQGRIVSLEAAVDDLHKHVASTQAALRTAQAEKKAHATIATEEMNVVKGALAVAQSKLETTEAQLDTLRKQSADREAASAEVTRNALQKIDTLQHALDEAKQQKSDADAMIAKLTLDVSSAEACLDASLGDVAQLESDLKLKTEEALLLADHIKSLEQQLVDADTNAKQLIAKHHDAVAELHIKMGELHARAVNAEQELDTMRLAAVADEKTRVDAQQEVASLREKVAQLMYKYAEAAAEAKNKTDELDAIHKASCLQDQAASESLAEIAALRAEHAMLVHKHACLAADMVKKDEKCEQQAMQIKVMAEELETQKAALITTKRLAAVREAELTRSLRATDDLIATLRQQHAAELEESKNKIKSLREANASLENDSRAAMMFSCAHAEMCVQLQEAQTDRKSAVARAERAVKENSQLLSHKVELEKKVEEAEKREQTLKQRLRSGRTWTLLAAGTAAVLFAAQNSKSSSSAASS